MRSSQAKLLVHRVVAVAHRGLRHLGDERLGKAQQKVLQVAARLEKLPQDRAAHAVSLAGALHHRAAWGALPAHEKRDPDQSLVAGDRDLGRGAVLEHVEERHDAVDRKVDEALRAARFVHRHAERHRHALEMLGELPEIGRAQRGEKPVGPGIGQACLGHGPWYRYSCETEHTYDGWRTERA